MINEFNPSDKPESDSGIAYSGSFFEVERTIQPNGKVFEKIRRAPGVRLIIPDHVNRTVLMSREFRRELNDWDWRLPGGKVFDTLQEYQDFRKTGQDIEIAAQKKATEEASEEVGVSISKLNLVKVSTLGASVEWDLHVYEANEWEYDPTGQKLEEGENIDQPQMFGYKQLEQMIFEGQVQEDRIALVLLSWLNRQQ